MHYHISENWGTMHGSGHTSYDYSNIDHALLKIQELMDGYSWDTVALYKFTKKKRFGISFPKRIPLLFQSNREIFLHEELERLQENGMV